MTGIQSNNPHVIVMSNVSGSPDNRNLDFQVTINGSNTAGNVYTNATDRLTTGNVSGNTSTQWTIPNFIGDAPSNASAVIWLYNWYSTSAKSHYTYEETSTSYSGGLMSSQQAGRYDISQRNDGVSFSGFSNGILTMELRLYELIR